MADNQYIASIATAIPPYTMNQEEVKQFFIKNYSNKLKAKSVEVLNKVFDHPSMQQRNFAFENLDILLNEKQDECVQRFTKWSIKLSTEAIIKALEKANLKIDNISGLVVNTCTGYLCPGISTYLLDSLGLKKNTKVYDLVGSGCGGAIPNIELCRGLLNGSPEKVIVSVSVEICTCTYQMADDLSLIISNALFGDGAAAAVIWNRPTGLKLISSHSKYAPQYRDDIRFIYKNGRLYNQLTVRLPKLAAKTALEAVNELLDSNGLKINDIKYWALHSGGDKVINEIKEQFGLREEQLKFTRKVLAQCGNLSSPTVWFVLNEMQKEGLEKDKWLVMLAFGAGLVAHAMLIKTQTIEPNLFQ
jgi:predicted naringenin-chalcone synthase